MRHTAAIALALAVAAAHAGAALAAPKPWLCPPKGFDSVPNFDVAKYISAPWYVQSQLPLKAQPVTSLFCVRANYTAIDPKNLAKGVRVCNFATKGAVNGPAMGTCLKAASPAAAATAVDLVAVPWPAQRSDPATAASKLLVAPSTVIAKAKTTDDLAKPPMPGNPRLAGPYWVVAVGKSKTPALGYDWAIVTGGSPSRATDNDACLPPATTDDGVWLFHRQPVAPKADMAAMMAAAQALRIDTTALVPVAQAKCTYAAKR